MGALCAPWDEVDYIINNAHKLLDMPSFRIKLTSIAIFDKQSIPVD